MKKLLLILSVALLTSCVDAPEHVDGDSESLYDIKYIKDSRTGLCFAERGLGSKYSFTCVPCTEKVENLIGK